MAIDAKMSFLQQFREKLLDKLTVDQMNAAEKAVMSLFDGFDLCELSGREDDDYMLDSYVSAMKVECRSQKTIDRYVYVIGKLMNFSKTTTRRISVYHLRSYLAAQKERGLSESTMEGERQIFSAYFNWLQRESLIERNPCTNLGVIKVPKKEKKTYTDIELERLNRCCENIRDRAILHFLRSTGCRISEVTELNRDSVNIEKRECIVHGKGNKERVVYLDDVAAAILDDYLKSRKDDLTALFISKRHERIQQNGIRVMLKNLAKKAGVDHVHPHKFRRTLATDLTRHGMPIQEVARILGHDKLDTTMKYVVLNNDDIKAAYRRYA